MFPHVSRARWYTLAHMPQGIQDCPFFKGARPSLITRCAPRKTLSRRELRVCVLGLLLYVFRPAPLPAGAWLSMSATLDLPFPTPVTPAELEAMAGDISSLSAPQARVSPFCHRASVVVVVAPAS